jgi:hypothetical protein
MDKRIIWLLGLGLSFQLLTVPLRLISPKEVNSTTGFVITSTGNYLLSDDVYVNVAVAHAIVISNSNVTLDLNGKTLASNNSGIRISTGFGNITIKNGTINGCSTGLTIDGSSSDIYVEQMKFINQRTFAISSGVAQRLYIRNCTVSNCVNNALSFNSLSDSELINTNISNTSSSVGIFASNCSRLRFKNMQISKNNNIGLLATSCDNFLIEDSLFNQNASYGLALVTTSSTLISGCIFCGNSDSGLLIGEDSGGNLVRNCTSYSNAGLGFSNAAAATTLLGNLAYNNTTRNYGTLGLVSYIQVNNGAQMAPGSVIDPKVDNISIG